MTSWVFTIDRNYPEHWAIARESGFWDTTRNAAVAVGDVVYFWQSGGSFVGRAIVNGDPIPIDATTSLPWKDSDHDRKYKSRIPLSQFTEPKSSAVGMKWGEVQNSTGIRQGLNTLPKTDSSEAEEWLASLFIEPEHGIEDGLPDVQEATEILSNIESDLRERTVAMVALRRGQPRFRADLLHAYQGRCAITGSTEKAVLEAAHISPYKGEHTNDPRNGILLRADVHTLFDLHLVTVVETPQGLVTRVSPQLEDVYYTSLDRKPVLIPTTAASRPDPEILRAHNASCEWLR